jgi:peptide/nickel transport system ATP-binding protein
VTTEHAVLTVTDLRSHLNGPDGAVRAVDGVSFEIAEGRTVGIVGESGSGKTVLGRSIAGLYDPADLALREGSVILEGVDLRALSPAELRDVHGRALGIIFQNPLSALNPVMRIGEQLAEQLRLKLRLDRRAALGRAAELLASVGLGDVTRLLRSYPHELSGGMRQRIMIAIAISCDPKLIIADEPTTALDVTVQREVLDLLDTLQEVRRMAMILITHDLAVVADRADEVAVMYAGRFVERAPVEELFARPLMPYTRALLAAIPKSTDPPHTRLQVIPGGPPDLVRPPGGCAFAPRCPRAQARCVAEAPPLVRDEATAHEYRCWFPDNGSVS